MDLVSIKSYRCFNLIFKKWDMARKDSEVYSISEGIYVFVVLFPIWIFCYQLFSNYVPSAIKNLFVKNFHHTREVVPTKEIFELWEVEL